MSELRPNDVILTPDDCVRIAATHCGGMPANIDVAKQAGKEAQQRILQVLAEPCPHKYEWQLNDIPRMGCIDCYREIKQMVDNQ